MRTGLAVFGLALAVRLAALWLLAPYDVPPGHEWDAGWETGQIADSLARGFGFALSGSRGTEPLHATAWLAPLYPAWVGGIFFLLGSFTRAALATVFAFQALFDAITAVALLRLGGRVGRPRSGVWAGWLYALSPMAINTSTRVLWCTSLLTMLCVWLVVRFAGHELRLPAVPVAAVTGALAGVCLLTAPPLRCSSARAHCG